MMDTNNGTWWHMNFNSEFYNFTACDHDTLVLLHTKGYSPDIDIDACERLYDVRVKGEQDTRRLLPTLSLLDKLRHSDKYTVWACCLFAIALRLGLLPFHQKEIDGEVRTQRGWEQEQERAAYEESQDDPYPRGSQEGLVDGRAGPPPLGAAPVRFRAGGIRKED